MRDFAFFVTGFVFCVLLIWGIQALFYLDQRRRWSDEMRRISEALSANRERGDAPATLEPENSHGGGDVTPPPHLRVVHDEKNPPQAGQERR